MTLLRIVVLACFTTILGTAGTWSGALVDAKCYASRQTNVNPFETSPGSMDTQSAIRYCPPSAKTKVFAIVQQDGSAFTLDSSRNNKIVKFLQKTGKRSIYVVDVTGAMHRNALTPDLISMSK